MLTKKILHQLAPGQATRDFVIRNKLIGMPLTYFATMHSFKDTPLAKVIPALRSVKLDSNNNVVGYNIGFSQIQFERDQNGCSIKMTRIRRARDSNNVIGIVQHSITRNQAGQGIAVHYTDTQYPNRKATFLHDYDDSGNLTHVQSYRASKRHYSVFDDTGKLHNNLIYHYDSNGNIVFKTSHRFFEYDAHDNLIRVMSDNEFGHSQRKVYDDANNCIYSVLSSDETKAVRTWRKYDKRNNLIETRSDNVYHNKRFEYDERNNLIMQSDGFGNHKTLSYDYYDSGQLKRVNDLILPYIENSYAAN